MGVSLNFVGGDRATPTGVCFSVLRVSMHLLDLGSFSTFKKTEEVFSTLAWRCCSLSLTWLRSSFTEVIHPHVWVSSRLAAQQIWFAEFAAPTSDFRSIQLESLRETVLSIFNALKLSNCQKQQAVTRPAVVIMAATAILTLFSLSARTAEVVSKLMHDVETDPGPNCSGVSCFLESNPLY